MSKSDSLAASIAEGGRPLKRGSSAIVNASEDNDDIFGDSEPKRRRGEDAVEKKGTEEEDISKSKHTLDSDEEDEEKYERLDMKKVDGQEDETIEYDGDTKITAFNMKEEEDDGHFDSAGNFIFNKKKEDVNDAWLDGIDWSRVKKQAGKDWQGEGTEEGDAGNGLAPVITDARRREIFGRLCELLKPSQTITKALAAVKKAKGLSAADERKARWAAKKAGVEYKADDGNTTTAELSSLADELLTAGHMDAYEWPREKVAHLLGKLTSTAVDSVDMFGDPIPAAPSSTIGEAAADESVSMEDEVVMWEYKEDADDATPILGPFNSTQMETKQDNGELAAKGVARKVGSGSFNPVARIDFGLYT